MYLEFRQVDAEDVFVFWLQVGHKNVVVESLHATLEQVGENEGSLLHDADVPVSRVGVLTVLDRVDEPVLELLEGTQQPGLDEVHHRKVLTQVVLERRACANKKSWNKIVL